MVPTGQFDPSHEHQVTGSDFPGTISNYENLLLYMEVLIH